MQSSDRGMLLRSRSRPGFRTAPLRVVRPRPPPPSQDVTINCRREKKSAIWGQCSSAAALDLAIPVDLGHSVMVFAGLVSMYGHGMGSSPMKQMDADLLDLCTASNQSEYDAMACVAKGHSITDYGAKRAYITGLSDNLKRCPYLTCVISTPGDPVIAPGITSP